LDFKLNLAKNGSADITRDVEKLRRELAKTKLINKKLYDFCVENIMK